MATQSDTVTGRASAISDAAGAALRRPANWFQLAKFCAVGASGYVVNLAVFAMLIHWADVHYLVAAVCSFLVAVTNNYMWNRLWTFRHQRGHIAHQGAPLPRSSRRSRSAPTSSFLAILVALGVPKVPAQAIAIALVTPLELRGQQALELPTAAPPPSSPRSRSPPS